MRRPVLGSLALTTSLVLTLSGCGGDEPSATPPTASSPTSPTTPDPGSSSDLASPSEAPDSAGTTADPGSGDTYASFDPATGTTLTGPSFTVSIPADWQGSVVETSAGGSAGGPTPRYLVALNDIPGSSVLSSLDEQVESAKDLGDFGPDVQRLPDVVVAGTPAYHLAGVSDFSGNFEDEIGFEAAGRIVRVNIATPTDLDQATRDEFVGTVMASLQPTTDG